MTQQDLSPQTTVRQNGPRDLLARLYREIGISAVAAALESSARKPEKPAPTPISELPPLLRNNEAA